MPSPRISSNRWIPLLLMLAWPPLCAVIAAMAWSESSVAGGRLATGVRLESAWYATSKGRTHAVDVYRAATADEPVRPVILALHGGGWRGGSRRDIGVRLANALVPRGIDVVSADYTLSRPGSPGWPMNLKDALEAVQWVHDQASSRGWDRRRVVVWGESAGGHLGALIGTHQRTRDREEPWVSAVVAYYAPTDLPALKGPAAGRQGPIELLLGGPTSEHPIAAREASPMVQVTPRTAPMVLVHGEDDLVVPPAQTRGMASALRAASVPVREIIVPGARHGFGPDVLDRGLVPEVLEFLGGIWNDNLKTP